MNPGKLEAWFTYQGKWRLSCWTTWGYSPGKKGRRVYSNCLLNGNCPDKASVSALASWKHYWFKSASFVTISSPIFPELWTFLIMAKFNYFLLSILISDIRFPRKPTSQILRNDTCSAHSWERFFFPLTRILNCKSLPTIPQKLPRCLSILSFHFIK